MNKLFLMFAMVLTVMVSCTTSTGEGEVVEGEVVDTTVVDSVEVVDSTVVVTE